MELYGTDWLEPLPLHLAGCSGFCTQTFQVLAVPVLIGSWLASCSRPRRRQVARRPSSVHPQSASFTFLASSIVVTRVHPSLTPAQYRHRLFRLPAGSLHCTADDCHCSPSVDHALSSLLSTDSSKDGSRHCLSVNRLAHPAATSRPSPYSTIPYHTIPVPLPPTFNFKTSKPQNNKITRLRGSMTAKTS